MAQKIIRIGSSSGVTLSSNALQRLGLKVGDAVSVDVDSKSQVIKISPIGNEDQARRVSEALEIIEQNRYALDRASDE